MTIRCCFPCIHISDWQMKIHGHREIDLSLRIYMTELWISLAECWISRISIVNHGYPLSFAFGFPYIPIYWLYQDCYLFRTWSKCFACVKIKSFHSYIYMGWNIDIQHCYALRNRREKILRMFSTTHCTLRCNIFGLIWIWLPLIPILKWFW